MTRMIRRVLPIAAAMLLICATGAFAAQTASGVVFADTNRNGARDSGEQGLPGVRVSNGRAITTTNDDGAYNIRVSDDCIIFVIKPRGWRSPLDADMLPRFYYIHKPKGSPPLHYKGVEPTGPLPQSVDFPLYPSEEPDTFTAIFFGDTQPSNLDKVRYLGHDIVEELIGCDAQFGVTLGDICSNQLELLPAVNATVGRIGIPWHNVKGNHDTNYDGAPDQDLADETFERIYGPACYSFDYGPVHFVVLSNSYWSNPPGYEGRLDFRQLAFLRNDLALVEPDRLVVLMMHIPLHNLHNRTEVYRLLEKRPHTFSISGHTHRQFEVFIGKSDGYNGATAHHHLVNGTVCGPWWGGAPDEVGLPTAVMADGTPNGYSIITFSGTSYSVRYKVARRPADYQMNIFAPETVEAADVAAAEVLVNVFAGSEQSTVQMKIGDGDWAPMELDPAIHDPYLVRTNELEREAQPLKGYSKSIGSTEARHIWKARLPAGVKPGTQTITVRTTDRYGATYTARRLITVL